MKAIVGKRYRHYKGKEYTVLALARLESNPNEEYVVYRAEYASEFGEAAVWLRERTDFESTVKLDDIEIERFTAL